MHAASTGAITSRALPRRNLPQRSGARLLNLRMRRKILKRQHIVRRQPQHLRRIQRSGQLAGAASTAACSASAALLSATTITQRALRRADEVGKIERPRRRGQSGHTSAPRASAQMAAYTLKGLRVFKVRKQLADEGKNHADLILVEVPCQSCGRLEYYLAPAGKIACAAARFGGVRCVGRQILLEVDDEHFEKMGRTRVPDGLLPLLAGCTRHSKKSTTIW